MDQLQRGDGICSRQGLGKLRHLDTHTHTHARNPPPWTQLAGRSRRVDLRQGDGDSDPADLFTKHGISRQRLEGLIALYSCRFLSGRADSAPVVKQCVTTLTTVARADQELANVEG